MSPALRIRPTTLLARFVARQRIAPPGAACPLSEARTTLVVKLDALGDFVLATPFLRLLRQAAPRAHITLFTRGIAAPLAADCPHVDAHHVLDIEPRRRRFGELRRVNEIAGFIRRTCGDRRFDYAFVPRAGPDLHHARLVAWLSGAAARIGFSMQPADAIAGDAALTTEIPYPAAPLPEAEANVLLLRAVGVAATSIGALELHCSSRDEETVAQRLASLKITADTPLLALGVGASLPHKIWPAEKFLALARDFAAKNWQVVFLGNAADAANFPADEPRLHNWSGQLTPSQSFALLRRARLFVGNDSGALHLAAAAGCPCVVITWDTPASSVADVNSHRRFAPYGVPHRFVHPAGQQSAAALVDVESVALACDDLLAATTSKAERP